MYTKFIPHPGASGFGVLSSLGLALLRQPMRVAARTRVAAPAQGRHSVRGAAVQLSTQPHESGETCDINQVLRRMVRIARTLVPPGVRIAERYTPLEQPCGELPEFHQVVLHLILDAAQALQGCGTIDVASRWLDGQIQVSISDTRASAPAGWGLMAPLIGTGGAHAECESLGLLMAGDFAEEHGGRVSTTRLAGGGNAVTITFALASQALA